MAKRRLKVLDPTKYRGAVNPKLRALMKAQEYRNIIALLTKLEDKGLLDDFLGSAEDFWMRLDIFQLMAEEKKGGAGIMNIIRKEWPRMWPSNLDTERMDAFEVVSGFLNRLDASRLVDVIFEEVLPDMGGGRSSNPRKAKSSKSLQSMSDQARREEIMNRLGSADIVQQYITVCADDKEVQKIAPKMAPFMAQFMSTLERKAASQTLGVGKLTDTIFFGVVGLVLVGIASAVGWIQLPFMQAPDVGKRAASYSDFMAAAERQSNAAERQSQVTAASLAALGLGPAPLPTGEAPPTTP